MEASDKDAGTNPDVLCPGCGVVLSERNVSVKYRYLVEEVGSLIGDGDQLEVEQRPWPHKRQEVIPFVHSVKHTCGASLDDLVRSRKLHVKGTKVLPVDDEESHIYFSPPSGEED